MPYSDDLRRDYTAKEARFWREAQHAAKERNSVRLVPIAQSFGIGERRVGQIGRTWQNGGLCTTAQSGRVIITLTSFGRRFTFEKAYSDIEQPGV